MMDKIRDCACLFESLSYGMCYLVTMDPCDYTFENDFQSVQTNVFPEYLKNTDSAIYSFTIGCKYAHVYKFTKNSKTYAFLFITQYNYPKIFSEFLESIKRCNDDETNELSPDQLFTYSDSLLKSWYYTEESEEFERSIHVSFHDKEYNQSIIYAYDNTLFWNQFTYIPKEVDFKVIWSAIIAERTLYICCEDPVLLYKAVYSMEQFVLPREYKGRVLISLDKKDERPLTEDALIIGTTCKDYCKANGRLGVILTVKEERNDPDDNVEEDYEEWAERSGKLEMVIKHIMSMKLGDDPLYEMLGHSPLEGDIKVYIKDETEEAIPPIWAIVEYGKSKTFNEWFENEKTRTEFREALMNVDVEHQYKNRTKEELVDIINALKNVSEKYKTDLHLEKVIKKHVKYIKTLIRE